MTRRLNIRKLRIKCGCGYWNSVPVNKIFVELDSPEPKVKVLIAMYEPLGVFKCKQCVKVIAEPKEPKGLESNIDLLKNSF